MTGAPSTKTGRGTAVEDFLPGTAATGVEVETALASRAAGGSFGVVGKADADADAEATGDTLKSAPSGVLMTLWDGLAVISAACVMVGEEEGAVERREGSGGVSVEGNSRLKTEELVPSLSFSVVTAFSADPLNLYENDGSFKKKVYCDLDHVEKCGFLHGVQHVLNDIFEVFLDIANF